MCRYAGYYLNTRIIRLFIRGMAWPIIKHQYHVANMWRHNPQCFY